MQPPLKCKTHFQNVRSTESCMDYKTLKKVLKTKKVLNTTGIEKIGFNKFMKDLKKIIYT